MSAASNEFIITRELSHEERLEQYMRDLQSPKTRWLPTHETVTVVATDPGMEIYLALHEDLGDHPSLSAELATMGTIAVRGTAA